MLEPDGLLTDEEGGGVYCISSLQEPILEGLLRERFSQSDCRLGIVIDGLTSKFCSSNTTLCNVVLKAIGKRRNIYAVSCTFTLSSRYYLHDEPNDIVMLACDEKREHVINCNV